MKVTVVRDLKLIFGTEPLPVSTRAVSLTSRKLRVTGPVAALSQAPLCVECWMRFLFEIKVPA